MKTTKKWCVKKKTERMINTNQINRSLRKHGRSRKEDEDTESTRRREKKVYYWREEGQG